MKEVSVHKLTGVSVPHSDKESKPSSKDKKKKKKKPKEVKFLLLHCTRAAMSHNNSSVRPSVFRKTKRTRRNTNTKKRKKTKRQRETRKRRRSPAPRRRRWTSWRTFWAEEPRPSRGMTGIMKNFKKTRKHSLTCQSIKHLQAARKGHRPHAGKISKDSGTWTFVLNDPASALPRPLPSQPTGNGEETHP